MASDELISREEALGGMPVQRARSLLFLIESRTAHQMARSRRVTEHFVTEESAEERDLAFLEAFSLGRDPPLKPAIQDLERYAEAWSHLVPDNPRLRAALAHLLGQKYSLAYPSIPEIRRTLGLDTGAVQRAFTRQYGFPLEEIYTRQLSFPERYRWAWSGLGRRLENLPPFWMAFSVTLTETVGASILALPIALARLGPLAGLVVLVAIGLLNVITIIYVAETLTRTGSVRYGNAYFKRLVADYLGNAGSLMFAVTLAFLFFLILIAYFTGISKTLEAATNVPAAIWAALVFLVSIYFIRRESLNATLATALLVGAVNIFLILVLSALALPGLKMEYLTYVRLPGLGGRPFERSVLELVFGVVLAAYFGHTSIANYAKVVLQRDTSGRALISGCMAAQLAAILLYSIWVLTIGGSISPVVLASQTGTVLIPLAAQVGPVVYVFGSLLVILGMGMATIHTSLSSYNLVLDWLPSQRRRVVRLSRRQGSLQFSFRQTERYPQGAGRDSPRLSLFYLGLSSGQPKFRLDVQEGERTQRVESLVPGTWDAGASLRIPGSAQLKIAALDATADSARVQVNTNLAISYRGDWDTTGLEIGSLLGLPEEEQRLFTWVLRQGGASLGELAAHTGRDESSLVQILDSLVDRGYLQPEGAGQGTRYQARLAHKRPRGLPTELWQALDTQTAHPPGEGHSTGGFSAWAQEAARSERGRFWLGILPLVAILVLVEWLLLSHAESFVAPLNFAGIIIVSLLAGTFPVLLLHASRRKGELLPGIANRLIAHPLVMGVIYLLTLGGIFLHGLVIWQNPFQRLVALLTGLLMLAVTWKVFRSGSFKPRATVELRQDAGPGELARFAVTASGEPLPIEFKLVYADGERSDRAAAGEIARFSSLCSAEFQLPYKAAPELKVWAHRPDRSGNSECLPVTVQVQCESEGKQLDIIGGDGQRLLQLGSGPCLVSIRPGER